MNDCRFLTIAQSSASLPHHKPLHEEFAVEAAVLATLELQRRWSAAKFVDR